MVLCTSCSWRWPWRDVFTVGESGGLALLSFCAVWLSLLCLPTGTGLSLVSPFHFWRESTSETRGTAGHPKRIRSWRRERKRGCSGALPGLLLRRRPSPCTCRSRTSNVFELILYAVFPSQPEQLPSLGKAVR